MSAFAFCVNVAFFSNKINKKNHINRTVKTCFKGRIMKEMKKKGKKEDFPSLKHVMKKKNRKGKCDCIVK